MVDNGVWWWILRYRGGGRSLSILGQMAERPRAQLGIHILWQHKSAGRNSCVLLYKYIHRSSRVYDAITTGGKSPTPVDGCGSLQWPLLQIQLILGKQIIVKYTDSLRLCMFPFTVPSVGIFMLETECIFNASNVEWCRRDRSEQSADARRVCMRGVPLFPLRR